MHGGEQRAKQCLPPGAAVPGSRPTVWFVGVRGQQERHDSHRRWMVQHFILIEKTEQNQLRTIGSCRQPRQGGGQHLLVLQEKDPVPSSPGTDVVVWLYRMMYRN